MSCQLWPLSSQISVTISRKAHLKHDGNACANTKLVEQLTTFTAGMARKAELWRAAYLLLSW